MTEQNTNQEQKSQSIDVVGIVAKAMYSCQADITKVFDLLIRENGAIMSELKKAQEVIATLKTELDELKAKPKE